MAIMYEPPLLTTEQVAEQLNLHPSTLEKGRQSHRKDLYPPFIKIGRAVRYRASDLQAWLDRSRVHVGEAIA